MALPLIVSVLVFGQQASERFVMLPGDNVTLGRQRTDTTAAHRGSPYHFSVAPSWLGLRRVAEVSNELLRIAYYDDDGGIARLGWRTGAKHHPASIRIRPVSARPGTTVALEEPPIEGHGELEVADDIVPSLQILRLGREGKFCCRLLVRVETASVNGICRPQPGPVTGDPPELARVGHLLLDKWWGVGKQDPPGALTWRVCLRTGDGLVRGTPVGQLAAYTSAALEAAGFARSSPRAVRNAWANALRGLVRIAAADHGEAVFTLLPVPGLAEYVTAIRRGQPDVRLRAGEEQIRVLLEALRAIGWSDW